MTGYWSRSQVPPGTDVSPVHHKAIHLVFYIYNLCILFYSFFINGVYLWMRVPNKDQKLLFQNIPHVWSGRINWSDIVHGTKLESTNVATLMQVPYGLWHRNPCFWFTGVGIKIWICGPKTSTHHYTTSYQIFSFWYQQMWKSRHFEGLKENRCVPRRMVTMLLRATATLNRLEFTLHIPL